jgi:hypothetical protein
MKRFNAQTVRPSSHLQPTSEKAKRYHRKVNGIVQFRSAAVGPKPDDKPKDREFYLPRREDYKPPRLRGASGTRLSPAKRSMVELRTQNRKAFFAELGVVV